jgi:hypothetical protein
VKRIIGDFRHRIVVTFMELKVGDKAPDFTLPSQMGDNVTLSEFFGKKPSSCTSTPKTNPLDALGKPAVSGTATMSSRIWALKSSA